MQIGLDEATLGGSGRLISNSHVLDTSGFLIEAQRRNPA
jgi:hypothetical protein